MEDSTEESAQALAVTAPSTWTTDSNVNGARARAPWCPGRENNLVASLSHTGWGGPCEPGTPASRLASLPPHCVGFNVRSTRGPQQGT